MYSIIVNLRPYYATAPRRSVANVVPDRMNSSQPARTSAAALRTRPRKAHSHTISTHHPPPRRCQRIDGRLIAHSVPSIFLRQKSAQVAGSWYIGQTCPCQKQPCTNITACLPGNTRSGLPGRSLRCNWKRKPRACRPRRSRISGFVSRPLPFNGPKLLAGRSMNKAFLLDEKGWSRHRRFCSPPERSDTRQERAG
jgi:hypothetical protein